MHKPSQIITLTTDFGTSDVYVGVMKGVILNINPNAKIVDITHSITPQNIREAAFTINAAYRFFPKGTIHVIVVDPGVGSDRQAIVFHTDTSYFVCPNNGVLSYLLQDNESENKPLAEAVVIQNPDYLLPRVCNTFHGRDIFAPVAAHLSLGITPDRIGNPTTDLVRLTIPALEITENTLTGEIINVDSFGNLITNISENVLTSFLLSSTSEMEGIRELDRHVEVVDFEISVGNTSINRLNSTYTESQAGTLLAIISSFGLVEIAVNMGNASSYLGLKIGDKVMVHKKV